MKKKSAFSQIMLLVIIALACIVLTTGVALLVGTMNISLFDWKNLNFANMIPVFIVGGFLTCVIVGIAVMIVSRSLFFQIRDFLFDNKDHKNKGEKEE